ncbi:nitric oxide-sensing protein NosP [Noviherbaspirillum denitrificans]|uniref:FIST domain containing protein n=1 Tax=Noviherbaspirillum denitrificans TaxID=1968433 RepID=A0A254TNX5_9BURK|nr:nitric oxide-sensing protein NosP [Noviherbaspirillum denitrificans]OWW21408.1 FIST domain containing protein [Noviherbaspirillum denitrificans]
MSTQQPIRTSQSCAADAREAVREFHASVAHAEMALVMFFCSIDYDLDAVADEMRRLFGNTPVVGCTTAGEIGPAGYRGQSISGASFPAGSCTAVTGHLDCLRQFEMTRGQAFTQSLLHRLQAMAPGADPHNSFAFLLIDGMSVREEPVTRSLQMTLGRLPMFGGSAGDGLKFAATQVFHDGSFHEDSAVLVVATTALPFRIFKTQHFISTDERMVVTEADADARIVREINGLPAAQEYARMVGVDVDDLDPMRFAASPVVVLIDGMDYVRSIQKANPDGSLTFYCAIEEGLVLRVARGVDLVENLVEALERVEAEIGRPQVVFGCDCILRQLEIVQCGLRERVSEVLGKYNTVGFNTYGEQFGGVHVNQTFTGIAIGSPKEAGNG